MKPNNEIKASGHETENFKPFILKSSLEIKAATSEEDRPRGTVLIYSGGLMNVGWGYPVIIDLSSIKVNKNSVPMLREHDPNRVMGYLETVQNNGKKVSGEVVFTSEEDYVTELIAQARRGQPWEVSLFTNQGTVEYVEAGTSVTINRRTIKSKSPFYIAKKAELQEVSVVAMGADRNTKLIVASHWDEADTEQYEGENNMPAPKPEPESTVKKSNAVKAGASTPTQNPPASEPDDGGQNEPDTKEPDGDVKASADLNAENERLKAELATLKASGLKAENELLQNEIDGIKNIRASRPGFIPAFPENNEEDKRITVLKATAMRKVGLSIKEFDNDIQAAANRDREMSVKELILKACAIEGIRPSDTGSASVIKAAAFSTIALGGILEGTANASMLAQYRLVESVIPMIAASTSVSNFLQYTRFRITGASLLKQIGRDGQIPDGSLGNESYTQQAETYGLKIALSRENIINDDLSAFAQIPAKLGNAAGNTREYLGFKALTEAAFFTAGNANLLTGSASALSIDTLSSAEQKLGEQEDADENPINLSGKYLVVPPALKTLAKSLYKESSVQVTTTTNKKLTADNPHKGSFEPVSSAWLKKLGNSTQWYLFADPAQAPVLEIAYLNGQEEPMIQQTPIPGVLGLTFECIYDIGIKAIDYRGGVKAEGTD